MPDTLSVADDNYRTSDQGEDLDEEPSLVPANVITQICGRRDAALARLHRAAALLEEGHRLAEEAQQLAGQASAGATFHLVERNLDAAYRRLFHPFDREASKAVFRRHADACVWVHLLRATGMERMMDAEARDTFFAQLAGEVPEVNESNVYATLQGFRDDAELIFQRGLARAFASLDRRFKSHDAFRFKDRVILTHVFNEHGSWSYYNTHRGTLADVERVLAVLDGQVPDPGALERAINDSRGHGWGPRQGCAETRYLRIRSYKNGNAHLWFCRPDLVDKANQVLADFYGAVLPDAVPAEEEVPVGGSGLPAKDLSFYPSPEAVVRELLRDLWVPRGARVLEPSAGTGAIVRGVLEAHPHAHIDAVEIEASRVAALGELAGVQVIPANFLTLPVRPEYDLVVMNPPLLRHALDGPRPARLRVPPAGGCAPHGAAHLRRAGAVEQAPGVPRVGQGSEPVRPAPLPRPARRVLRRGRHPCPHGGAHAASVVDAELSA